MPYTVWILTLAQALSMSVAPLLVFSGGILGSKLAPDPALATLPVALMVLGTATAVMPLTRLMQRWGRKKVFIIGTIIATSGSFLAAWGIYLENFIFFCTAGIVLGTSLAAAQQYRFAAMEEVCIDKAGVAASRVLLGGLLAAYLGPELVVFGESLMGNFDETAINSHNKAFIGAFILLGCICFLALWVIVFGYKNHYKAQSTIESSGRSMRTILSNPLIWLAILASAIGYAMMSFMMTATPLNMHQVVGHSLTDTKWVIQSHIMAMFLPSFFSGWLISKLGHRRLIALGIAAYVICICVAASGHHLMHYWWALVLLGIGWNFLFVGGTALLPLCYKPTERFRVQSFNELSVFGLQAISALSAGWVISQYGWEALLMGCCVMIVVVMATLWINRQPGQ